MSRKKISTTIYVTPEQSDKLKLLHERTKVPVAVYIREGIDLVLRHYAHLLPGQLALEVSEGRGAQRGEASPPERFAARPGASVAWARRRRAPRPPRSEALSALNARAEREFGARRRTC